VYVHDLPQKTGTVIRPVQAVSENIFIWTVRPRRIVNCLTAPPRNILTYLLIVTASTVETFTAAKTVAFVLIVFRSGGLYLFG